MEYIIIFIMIYTTSGMLAIKLNKRIEETVPISIVGIVLTIYIFGLFNNLTLGIIVLGIIVLISLVYLIKLIAEKVKSKQSQEVIEKLITPGILIYLILITISIILNQNRVLEIYDSFNHWALIVKNMFINNNYGTNTGLISFNEYPPFTGTFQYLLLKLRGEYSEDTIIIAQNILYFSMILPIFKKIECNKSIAKALIILPIAICLPFIFYERFYTEILVDGFIGITFALSIFTIYKKEENKIYKNIILATYLIALTLTKNIGILFTIIVIIVDIILKYSSKRDLKNELKQIGILVIIILIVGGSWYIKIAIDNASLNWGNPEKIYHDAEERNQIVNQYFNEIFNNSQEITIRDLSAFMCFTIYMTLSILVYKQTKEKNILIVQISMTITIIIYTILMLIPYLTLFEKEETMILSSFNRYISSILLSGFFLNMLIIFDKLEIKAHHIIYVITILVLFLPFDKIQHMYVHADTYNDMVMYKRDKYASIKYFANIFNSEDKIYLVADNIFDKYYVIGLNKYEVLPAKIGNKDFKEIPTSLDDYTYIYVINENKQFYKKAKEIFGEDTDLQENALYKIVRDKEELQLERVLIRDIM